jgi:hypothetical protein
MAITTDAFITGEKAAVTNGNLKVTFDTPSDFADWLVTHADTVDLRTLQWVRP